MKNTEKVEEFKVLLRQNKKMTSCIESLDSGHLAEAVECFDAYVKKNPNDMLGHTGRALALHDSGESEKAIEALTDGLKINNNYEPALLIRAEILREEGKLEFALRFYDKLLGISEGDQNYLRQKAQILKAMDRHEEAEAIYERIGGPKEPVIPHEKCPKCGFTKEVGKPCPFCSIDEMPEEPKPGEDVGAEPNAKIVAAVRELEDDDLNGLDLDEIDKLSSSEELADAGPDTDDDIGQLEDMVCDGCGSVLDMDDPVCGKCGLDHAHSVEAGDERDQVMIVRGIPVEKVSERSKAEINNYEEDRWSDFVDKARADKSRTINIVGVFCIISIAIYLIFISMLALYDSFFVEFDTNILIPNLVIFAMGFGALYGGINIAKNSIVFDHFLDSVFEMEIYPRLEPALEEVATVQARLDNIEERIERMNMNLSRQDKYPSAAEFPAVAITNRITSFLKIVVVLNLSIGMLLFALETRSRFSPYLFTVMFMLWWATITDDFNLWKDPISWGWAIFPVIAVPVMSMFLFPVLGQNMGALVGLISLVLALYVYAYYAYVRYYVEGKLPFDIHEAQLDEEDKE